MRIREAVVSLPLHPGGLNNNQLRRSEQNQPISEEIENRNDISLTNAASVTRSSSSTDFILEDNDDFRVAEDTTTWSSLAITRENVQIDTSNENVNDNDNDNESLNNNLTSPGIHRNSSDESLTDYEGRNSSREDSFHEWTPPDWSGCSEERSPLSGWRGIVNPNYLGFQHLKPSQLWPTHLNEDELDYPWLNDFDTRLTEEDNYLCVQENEKKNFYKKPYIIPTASQLFTPVLLQSINRAKSADDTETEEKGLSEKSDVINEEIEAKPYLKPILVDGVVQGWELLDDEEALPDPTAENSTQVSTAKLQEEQERKLPVETEVDELASVKETPQYFDILDSGKSSKVETPPSCDSESLKEESIADEAKTEEKVSEKSDVTNEGVEAEPYLKAWKKILVDGVVKGWELSLGDEETLLDPVTENSTELSTTKLEEKQEREVPVEIEIVELTTSVKETLQFPEIEEIPDSGKTSEVGETEDIVVEHIDLIREAKELPHQARSKIGNRQTITSNGSADDDSESNTDTDSYPEEQPTYTKLEEIDLLSSIGRDIGVDLEKYVQPVPDVVAMEAMDPVHASSRSSLNMMKDNIEDTNKLLDRDLPEASSADTRKKEKMARNQAKRRQQQQQQQLRSSNAHRRPDKRRADVDNGPGGFDVYNIETAMPKIDLDAIESHLRAAREEERRRRNDREEIRRRLAMGPDAEDLRAERGRKPSLQSRLQSGMNLQICFMNETPSDTESPCSENDVSPESTPTSLGSKQQHHQQQQKQQMPVRPQVLSLPSLRLETGSSSAPIDEADFFAKQARLQTEARMALAQAKEMAHMQMEVERQRLKQSPITEMVRSSLEKVGVQLGEDRRRLSRVLLTDLNVAQLQVVANDLHARIAALNEALVEGLLRRDDLHMEQDSMLVDVEDLTRYLFCCVHMHRGAKQESLKKKQNAREQQAASRSHQQTSTGPNKSSLKPKLTHRGFVSLVRK
nr:PREDICTED: general transcriptional corepressor trfA isoform X1 [Megachile rotundata]